MSTRAERLRRWAAAAGVLVLLTGAASFLYFLEVRESAIQEIGSSAQRVFGGDRVAALMAAAGSDEIPLQKRNRAIWALGEIRDSRALPALRELDVQEECDHSMLVCQREVRKAIAKIRGEYSPIHTIRQGLQSFRHWIVG